MQPTPHSKSGPSDQPRAPPPPEAAPVGAAGPARGARPSPPPGLRAQPGSSTPGTADPATRPAVHAVLSPARRPGRALRSCTPQPGPQTPGHGPTGTTSLTAHGLLRVAARCQDHGMEGRGGVGTSKACSRSGPRPRIVAPPPGPGAPNRSTHSPAPAYAY